MWALLLLPLGLSLTPQPPGVPPEPGGGCSVCRSPHRRHVETNGTLGTSITLQCPYGDIQLGPLLAVRWHFGGVPVCSQGRRPPPSCSPTYRGRAGLGDPEGTLLLRGLQDGDEGTYSCVLLGSDDCACGGVTLRLWGAPCSPPCSDASTAAAFSLIPPPLLLLLLLPTLILCV